MQCQKDTKAGENIEKCHDAHKGVVDIAEGQEEGECPEKAVNDADESDDDGTLLKKRGGGN